MGFQGPAVFVWDTCAQNERHKVCGEREALCGPENVLLIQLSASEHIVGPWQIPLLVCQLVSISL